ncbi:MAG TPA: SoxR reducing system RseC family protein [Spirochaetota bacterium]|nr:SoxR reducing system RseC family protein [Spirochaetota bacterium]
MNECETGTVVEVQGDEYLIEPDLQEGCVSCRHRRSCHGSSGDQKRCLICSSSIELSVGDRVAFNLVFPLIYASVLLYLIPAILIILGAILGSRYISISSDNDINTLMGILTALPVSAVLVFLLRRGKPVAHVVRRESDNI